MNHLNEFKIQQLRTKNLIAAVESVAMIMGAVIANMLIPQLLIKYVYDPAVLVEAPAIFEYLPLITYSIGFGYFVFAMVSNFMRNRKLRALEQELYLTGGSCCSDGTCCSDTDADEEEISDEELKELERIVDEALKPAKKTATKATKKAPAKKAVKKKTAKK